MSLVRATDTKPEMRVRQLVYAMGYWYRSKGWRVLIIWECEVKMDAKSDVALTERLRGFLSDREKQ